MVWSDMMARGSCWERDISQNIHIRAKEVCEGRQSESKKRFKGVIELSG